MEFTLRSCDVSPIQFVQEELLKNSDERRIFHELSRFSIKKQADTKEEEEHVKIEFDECLFARDANEANVRTL